MPNNLNIDTTQLALNDDKMFLHDPAVYVDFHDGEGLRSLGYMEAEKTWKQTVEYATFKTGIPKSEIRRDIIDQEFTLEGNLKQVQPETLALLSQRRYDDSDSDWNRVIIGEAIPSPVYPSVVLVTQTVDSEEIRLFIRRAQITAEDFEMALGGDSHASIPFKITAQVDTAPLTTNPEWPYNPAYATQDNIAFWAFAKTGASS